MKLEEKLMLGVKYRRMIRGLLWCLMGLGCWVVERLFNMVMETTYKVGGLDAETDGLRPADIG